MKAHFMFIAFLMVITALVQFSCSSDGGNKKINTDTFDTADTPGDVVPVDLPGSGFDMVYTNSSPDDFVFPVGLDDTGAAVLDRQFFMGETEVTNALFAEALQWAYDNDRFSGTASDPDGIDSTTARHGAQQLVNLSGYDNEENQCRIHFTDGTFTVDEGYEEYPAVYVTWYGAIMFCNWLTEMIDGDDGNAVYAWVDNGDGDGVADDGTWQAGETDEDASKTGFRLPSSDEWEYAARYLGQSEPQQESLASEYVSQGHNNGDASLTAGYYWTPGNYASGAYTSYNDAADVNPANSSPDGKDANDEVAVYHSYWDGLWVATGVTGIAAGKSKGENLLGLHDVSGNAHEWCFTKSESSSGRITRGGGWDFNAERLQVGYDSSTCDPYFGLSSLGFRVAKSK